MRWPGPWEIALVVFIILVVFGVGKLPQVGGAIGKSIRAFKKAQQGDDEEDAAAKAKTGGKVADSGAKQG